MKLLETARRCSTLGAVLALATAAALALTSVTRAADVGSKPNVLLILADDLGWSDLGCYGGEIQTPHLDALAQRGLRFTQFYNTARCCPTRASLLTGLYPHQAGVGGMSNDRGPRFPGYRGTLGPDTVTLAEVLRDAGYRTYMVGKWHLHNAQGVKPTDRGFDEFYGMLGGFNSCWEETPFYTRWPRGRTPRSYTSARDGRPGTFYSTDAFADYALDFLADARQTRQPFFLYLAFNAPHFPLHAHAADIAKYEAMYFAKGWDVIRAERLVRQQQLGLVPKDLALTPRSPVPPKSHAKPSPYAGRDNPAWDSLPEDRRRDLARRMAVYAAMVDRMDVAVGRVVRDLEAHGQLEHTLLLFLSDNGACWEWDPLGFDRSSSPTNVLHTGEDLERVGGPASYLSYGSGWANAGNTPWRLYKHFSHEGGIRTPLIVHWPAGLAARGELRSQVGHLIDLMPTLVAVSGARYPAERQGHQVQPMEGRSLLPALANDRLPRDGPLLFEHEGSRAVRDGRWKLVSLNGDAWELYDLETDPTEQRDLIAQQPARARALAQQWEAWARRCQVEFPPAAAAAAPLSVPTPQRAQPASRTLRDADPAPRPNIVFILTDDFGWGDLGSYGGQFVPTPRLDRLAREGIRFTQFYVASPICSPSRAGATTGMCPARWRLTSYLQTRRGNARCEQADFLEPRAPSVARLLQSAGYATAHFGKWHLGGGRDVTNAPPIRAYGFDEWASTWESPSPHPDLTATNWIWSPQDPVKRWDRTAFFVDQTLDFLRRHPHQPCYVNLWPDDTHTPFVPSPAMKQRHQAGDAPGGERDFQGVLEEYDRQIGRLIDGLHDLGLATNTLVLFTGDNGPLPTYGQRRTAGLRGSKLSLYEGGLREPLLVWWPGHAPAARVNDRTVFSTLDLLPTLCALGGATLPPGVADALDGEDLSAALTGATPVRRRPLFWEYGRNPHAFAYPQEPYHRSPNLAVRDGDWKLLRHAEGTGAELYDLAADPKETVNLAAQHPAIVTRLSDALLDWRRSWPVP